MTINIIVTEAAIDRMRDATGYESPSHVEELIREILFLCVIEAPENPGNEREDSLDRILTDGIRTLGIHGVEYWRHKDLSGAIEDLVRKLSSKKNPAVLVEALEKIGSRTSDAKPPFRVLPADLMASTARSALARWKALPEVERGELVEAARDVIAYFDLFEGSTFAFLAANNPAFLVRIGRLRRALDGEKLPEGERSNTHVLRVARELIESIRKDATLLMASKEVVGLIRELARAVEGIPPAPEGERSEDTLFKTADSLMRYYAEEGSKAFVARFGSLEILEACRKIIREGEGSPHPWESEE